MSRFVSHDPAPMSFTGIHRPIGLAVIVAALALGACTTATPDLAGGPAAARCAGWSARDYASARIIRHLRIYTDRATGDSAIEETPMKPKATPLLKTGRILVEYDFGRGSKTQIVAAPGDLEIPLHPAPYRESFLILLGSVTMRLGDGTVRELVAGDMTTYEDVDASRGHGGRTGPCGYVALNIVP